MTSPLSSLSVLCLFTLLAAFWHNMAVGESSAARLTTESTVETSEDEHLDSPLISAKRPLDRDTLSSRSFILSGLIIRGTQLFNAKQLLPLYEDLLGNRVSPEELFNLAEIIENYYREQGHPYARVVVPRQNVRSGIVYLTVFEGRISRVRLIGENTILNDSLTPYLHKIPLQEPLDLNRLEHLSRVLNSLPGVSAQPSVELIEGTGNKFELLFYIRQNPNSGQLTVDNRGSKLLGPLRTHASYTFYNPLDTLSQIRFSHVSAPKHTELNYSTVTLRSALGSRGLELDIRGEYGEAEPGDYLKDLAPLIRIKQIQSSAHYPLSLGYHHGLTVYVGARYYTADVDILGARTLSDRLYTLRSGLNYWNRIPELYTNVIKLDVVHGLQGISDTISVNEGLASSREQEQFSIFKINARHSRWLSETWQLNFELDGQYSNHTLPSAELFSFGGASLGRAYDPGEIFGDQGLAGQISLDRSGISLPAINADANIYSFYDIGKAWNKGENHGISASSAGIGGKITKDKFDLSLEISQPLTRSVLLEEHGKNPRLFGKINFNF